METTSIFLGTELKLNVNIEPMGELTMEDYDWLVEVYCSAQRVVTVEKKEAIKVDSNNYVILVDSAELGAGDIKCKVTAYMPDFDFSDNYRTEVLIMDTGLNVIKTLQ